MNERTMIDDEHYETTVLRTAPIIETENIVYNRPGTLKDVPLKAYRCKLSSISLFNFSNRFLSK